VAQTIGIRGSDVRRYAFKPSKRGYDPAEVTQFVEVLAEELDRLYDRLDECSENESAALMLLRNATKTTDDLLAEANAEAERVSAEARDVAESARQDALAEATEMREATLRGLEQLEQETAVRAAQTNERVQSESTELLEDAELRAIEVVRRASIRAEAIVGDAREEAADTIERIEHAQQVMLFQAERLRTGSSLMADIAEEFEAISGEGIGDVIDLNRVSAQRAGTPI
jgi:DivIVA domain-containing protein